MLAAFPVLATVALIWLAAAVAPGPDFLLLTRIALRHGRAAALRAALGVTSGITVWGLAGFFGIHALFVAAPWLYLALKLGGGAYLVWLGLRLFGSSFRAAADPAVPPAVRGGAFWAGLATNLANPKAPLFTASLFAAAMPAHAPIGLGLAAVAVMAAVSALWYGPLVLALTTRPVGAAFVRVRRWVDRIAGAAFVGFGARLALER
jgi:threonine/homoserine/homoserine lactone efflux protein